jgi:hypothetical protein
MAGITATTLVADIRRKSQNFAEASKTQNRKPRKQRNKSRDAAKHRTLPQARLLLLLMLLLLLRCLRPSTISKLSMFRRICVINGRYPPPGGARIPARGGPGGKRYNVSAGDGELDILRTERAQHTMESKP